jgi:hypothetical protein
VPSATRRWSKGAPGGDEREKKIHHRLPPFTAVYHRFVEMGLVVNGGKRWLSLVGLVANGG